MHEHDKILNCQRCSNCCRVAGFLIPAMRRMKFDRTSKKDFTCRFFKEPNVCKVYETRPVQCRAAELPKEIVIKQKEICAYLRTTKKPDIKKVLELLRNDNNSTDA